MASAKIKQTGKSPESEFTEVRWKTGRDPIKILREYKRLGQLMRFLLLPLGLLPVTYAVFALASNDEPNQIPAKIGQNGLDSDTATVVRTDSTATKASRQLPEWIIVTEGHTQLAGAKKELNDLVNFNRITGEPFVVVKGGEYFTCIGYKEYWTAKKDLSIVSEGLYTKAYIESLQKWCPSLALYSIPERALLSDYSISCDAPDTDIDQTQTTPAH